MDNDFLIELKEASVYQQQYNLILSKVNLQMKQGEFAYLIGQTGSGKSSLLKTMYADLPLKEGYAQVSGYDLRHIKQKDIPYLRRKIGIVFQDFQLLIDRDVRENLVFVMKATGWTDKPEMESRIQNVLQLVGLNGKGFKKPHELSGGEQQRVSIARALINNPSLILADEPTGNLDPEIAEMIMNLLFDISKTGIAVLMATHNYSFFEKYPARTFRCEKGKVTEEGVEVKS